MLPVHYQVRFLYLSLVLVLAGAGVSGCGSPVQNLVTGEEHRGAYTWQQEVQIGTEAHQQVMAAFGPYDDEQLSEYVRSLGMSVLEESAWANPATPAEVRNTSFHFHVLDEEVPNAMALPGGYVYVTRGLLAYLENEAQLAMVLGHEVGHVLARHHSRQAAQAQLGQLGLVGAALVGGVIGGSGWAQNILDLGSAGVQLLFLRHSREAEREADLAGVSYAEFAGYDASEAASFFRSLERLGEQAGSIPNFLSTHPNPAERAATIPQLAGEIQPRGTQINRGNYLNQIEGMVLGENPRLGFTEGTTFHHPDLRFRFSFPSGWNLVNSAAAVQVGEPQGRAVMEFSFASDQNSAQASAQAFAAQQGFQATDRGTTTVNNHSAAYVFGTAAGQQANLGVVAYFIEHRGNVYRFLGMTTANAFGTYRNAFLSSINSFATETSASVLNRQPVRLEVVQVQANTPFRSLLSGRPTPPGMSNRELAIMNEVELDEMIPAGQTVKLPTGT